MTQEEAKYILEHTVLSWSVSGSDASEAIQMAIEALGRKKGKWVDEQCSICGCDIPAYIIDWKWQKDMEANFCPNCGAEMEIGEENASDRSDW